MTSKNLSTSTPTVPQVADLITLISSLDPTIQAIISEKLKLFTKSDTTIVSYDSVKEEFLPQYILMDIVHCDFTGVGFEWDGPHYALVWDVNPKFDSMMVIPATSQPRKDIHNMIPVGKITGLNNKETTLLVSDMTRVSRRRLTPVIYNHPKKGQIQVRLPMAWKERITEAIVATYTNEITFEEFLLKKCHMDMVDDIKFLDKWRYKPVKASYNPSSKTLKFCLWNQKQEHTFTLISPKQTITKAQREQMIKHICSKDQTKKSQSLSTYSSFY